MTTLASTVHCAPPLEGFWTNLLVLVGEALASYPGSCGGGEERAWYRPFAHALNYKLKNHMFVGNDV